MATTVDLFEALGPAIARDHAAQRESLPRALIVGDDASEALAGELGREAAGRRALVLFDARTRRAAGEPVLAALSAAGFDVGECLVPDAGGHSPVCDDVTLRALAPTIRERDVLVAVGSGVIGDLTKWLAWEAGVPSAMFATAASMNGFAAANVAPAIEGVKSLIHARAHRLLAADPRVLAAAPAELTSAGLGDVIAKSVSTADWKLNHLLFDEAYSDAIAGVLDSVERRYLEVPEALRDGDPVAVAALFEALVYSGCAMTLQGSSLPASGGEHLISHSLDMRATTEGGEHDLHGRQVGVATIVAAALYERVLALESPAFRADPLPFDADGWGAIAPSVAEHHRRQGARLAEACERLARPGAWARVREALGAMLPEAAWVKDVLQRAGAAHRIEDVGCTRERFTWALLNGAQMRERFTSLDLAWATGVLPDAAAPILDAWL